MDLTAIYNLQNLASASGVSYFKIRTNLSARQDQVKLTRQERDAIIEVVEDQLNNLKYFLQS